MKWPVFANFHESGQFLTKNPTPCPQVFGVGSIQTNLAQDQIEKKIVFEVDLTFGSVKIESAHHYGSTNTIRRPSFSI